MAFPGTYNINYYKGDTYEFTIYPKDSAGQAFALANYSVTFTISSSRGENPDFTVAATATIPQDAGNLVNCSILPNTGRSLDAGTSYVYDIQITNGANKIYTLLTGTITVTEDVTGA